MQGTSIQKNPLTGLFPFIVVDLRPFELYPVFQVRN